MSQKPWDHLIEPPGGGFRLLQRKIATVETEKRHFRLALITLVFAFLYLSPEGLYPKHFLDNPIKSDDWRSSTSFYQMVSEVLTPEGQQRTHQDLMEKIGLEWQEKQRVPPASILYEGKHFIQITVPLESQTERDPVQ